VTALDQIDATADLTLHINSPGGEVFEAVTILNALRRRKGKCTAVVDGLAASAASFIASGCDELVMGRNTEFMIHDAWGICIGPAADMRSTGDLLDHLSDNVASIYQAKGGGDLAAWRDLMLAETWMSAEETVACGLADRVEGADQGGDGAPVARFDLSIFRAQGRAAAGAPRVVPRTESTPGQNTCCATGDCCPADCNGTQCCQGDPGGCDGPCCSGDGAMDSRARASRHAAHRHQLAAARHGLTA